MKPTDVVPLIVVPLTLPEANAVVSRYHRHHYPLTFHRFSIGVVSDDGILRGACIVGPPVARLAGDRRDVAEVNRLATDGSTNACSMLYGAAARACKAMGFRRIQTYTLPSEGGASLRASGWKCEGEAGGGVWGERTDGRTRRTDQPTGVKLRWSLEFRRPQITVVVPTVVDDHQPTLWEDV